MNVEVDRETDPNYFGRGDMGVDKVVKHDCKFCFFLYIYIYIYICLPPPFFFFLVCIYRDIPLITLLRIAQRTVVGRSPSSRISSSSDLGKKKLARFITVCKGYTYYLCTTGYHFVKTWGREGGGWGAHYYQLSSFLSHSLLGDDICRWKTK